MKMSRLFGLIIITSLLAGCAGPQVNLPGVQATLPPPLVRVTEAPDSRSAINGFLEAWKNDDYPGMYALISQESAALTDAETFVKRYQQSMNSLTLKEFSYEILSTNTDPSAAQATYRVTFKTTLFGDIQRDFTANLKLEGSNWRIAWDDGLILPELKGGNYLSMDFDVPSRGIIYDKNDVPFVGQTDVMALGLIPNQIIPDQEGKMVAELARLLGTTPGNLTAKYEAIRYNDWYVALARYPVPTLTGPGAFTPARAGYC